MKKEKSFQHDTRVAHFSGDQRIQVRQIANQKHEIYIEDTDQRFNNARNVSYFSSLGYLLKDLNLILVPSYS